MDEEGEQKASLRDDACGPAGYPSALPELSGGDGCHGVKVDPYVSSMNGCGNGDGPSMSLQNFDNPTIAKPSPYSNIHAKLPPPPAHVIAVAAEATAPSQPAESQGTKRSIWICFKTGRPTEVNVEDSDFHVDHLKKRLKCLYPRHLGHLEAFEFAVKHQYGDKDCLPEDIPIDSLKPSNRAGNPLFIDIPDTGMTTPSKLMDPSSTQSPFTSPTTVYTSAFEDGTPPMLAGFQSKRMMDALTMPNVCGDMSGPRLKSKSMTSSQQTASGGERKLTTSLKKAADGLSKGHAVILLLNGEEVGRAKIVSCERGGYCKVRLKSYSGKGNTVTPEGRAFRDIGSEEFVWRRADCRRDMRHIESCDGL